MTHDDTHNGPNNPDDLSQLRRQARLNELRLKIAQQHAALAALRRAGHRDSLEGSYDPGNFFDPRDYLFERAPLFGALPTTRNDRDEGRDWPVFRTEQDLALIRGAARLVVNNNPTALGILTALTNYVVGNGFQYAVTARWAGVAELAMKADVLIREFLDENDWSGDLDRELFQRSRVDGEYFLALWHMGGGHVQARAVEPDQVTEPSNKLGLEEWLGRRSGTPVPDNPGGNRSRGLSGTGVPDLRDSWTFGVHTDDVDAQEIHGYYVQWTNRDTEWNYFPGGNAPIISPDGPGLWMLHARLNVVRAVKRGLSDFYPVQGNLDLARRVLRNMGEGSAVQAAIAWIQETAPGTTQAQTHTGTLSRADAQYYTRGAAGASRQHLVQQYDPATILKVPYGQKYLPGPLGGQHAPNFITSAEAILRTVALRWNLPEHLVTGTAENNNFASSLVAETPFVKYAESQQQFYAQRDRKTLWQVLKFGWQAGRLGNVPWSFVQRSLEITVTPPQIEVRDPEKETRVRQMLHAAGVLSRKTWSAQEGLDFRQEQQNLQQETATEAPSASAPPTAKPPTELRSMAPMRRAAAPNQGANNDASAPAAAAETVEQSAEPRESRDSLEGPFNPLLHPRGGYSQNRGWFSKVFGRWTATLRDRRRDKRSAPSRSQVDHQGLPFQANQPEIKGNRAGSFHKLAAYPWQAPDADGNINLAPPKKPIGVWIPYASSGDMPLGYPAGSQLIGQAYVMHNADGSVAIRGKLYVQEPDGFTWLATPNDAELAMWNWARTKDERYLKDPALESAAKLGLLPLVARGLNDPRGAAKGSTRAFGAGPIIAGAPGAASKNIPGGRASQAAGPVPKKSRTVAAQAPQAPKGPANNPKVQTGNLFNRVRTPKYPYNEVYVKNPAGGHFKLDSYNPKTGEIVSRKMTQLSEISNDSAVAYVREAATKYPPDAVIANVPSNGKLAGHKLQGHVILEVPIQTKPIPKEVLDKASKLGVIIRDVNGKVYNP